MDVQIGIDAYDYLSNQIFSINDDGKIICLKTLSEDETIKRLNGD